MQRIFALLFVLHLTASLASAKAEGAGVAQPNDRAPLADVRPPHSLEPHGPPPPLPENPPPAPPQLTPPVPVPFQREQVRRFIIAFLQASSAPDVEAELKFFAEHVDYFGQRQISREEIRRDLARYDARWPERHFTLGGKIQLQTQPDGRVRVIFPLRYELRNGARHSSGELLRTLVLQRKLPNELEIVAVISERAGP